MERKLKEKEFQDRVLENISMLHQKVNTITNRQEIDKCINEQQYDTMVWFNMWIVVMVFIAFGFFSWHFYIMAAMIFALSFLAFRKRSK